MATPPTEKPTLNKTPDSADEGPPQFAVSPTGYTTANSANGIPGFRPNALGKRNYILKRLAKETEKLRKANGSQGLLNDTYRALEKVPGRGSAGLIVTKTLDGSEGYGLDVTITGDENGKLVFNGNIEVEKNHIDDIFTFYTRKSTPSLSNTRRRKQRGGFYHSVYRGIAGATMLAPLIARQLLRMYETANKTRKSKSKKLSRNKRA
jgi:hypothetical protein